VEIALRVVQDSEVFLYKGPLNLLYMVSMVCGNKLSLNLLQDQLACASQLSLKGVIASNLVVNSAPESAKFRLCHACGMRSHSARDHCCSTVISAFVSLLENTGSTDTCRLDQPPRIMPTHERASLPKLGQPRLATFVVAFEAWIESIRRLKC
jgi:hypothetical protein